MDEALEQSALPAAAVVLSAADRRPLALGRHLGADPAILSARPGSTVKPILAWIAAEAGVLSPGEKIDCDRTYGEYHCFAAHGHLGLPEAIAASCNVYFFEVASRLGLERVSAGFTRFGFGERTTLVAQESPGLLIDSAWAASRAGSESPRWELVTGIGHGPIEVTPLQLAQAYAELGDRLARSGGAVPDALRAEILQGLRRGVADESGSGHLAAVPGLEIAGKTGSAEGGHYSEGKSATGPNNGWFVGFTPIESPRFIVAVVVIGGDIGGKSAAPIAARIFEGIAKQ
ncbi:MAG: hypothetical protein IT372_33585 [Polyangiaceae bacterium]|nr:hypothetical protein [Polyangiaceae bacterium]